jgi:CubicO group peptidase (beta-lactamase class C family)
MKKNVFIPLGMENSTFNQIDFLTSIESAIGHDKVPLAKAPIPMVAAGGMYSNVEDMARFVSFLVTGGQSYAYNIMRPATLKLLYTSAPVPEEGHVYYLGVDVEMFKGSLLANHNGGGYGFYATQDALINDGLGVVILTNSVNHPTIQHSISRRILADLIDIKSSGQQDFMLSKDSSLFEYIGLYTANFNGGLSKRAITMRNGSLYLGSEKLTPYSKDLFFTAEGESVEFMRNGSVISNVFHKKVVVD